MPEYFPDRRRLGKPLGRSPGLSGGINPRAASNRGGKKYNFSGSMDPAEYSMMMRKKNGDALAKASGMDPEQFDAHMKKKIANATKFVSGGRKMGEGVTASGKNNIVGFKRGGVRGSRKGLDSLVRTISTNIVNSTENTQSNVTNFARNKSEKTKKQLVPSVQKQTKNITRVVKPQVSNLNKTVNNVRNQAFNNIRTFRDSKKEGKESGTGLFGGLFGKIRNGLDLIKLLTNKKTQADLSKSIQSLEFFFNDAYRVAFRLRKNLIKIFKALRKIKGGAGGGLRVPFRGGRQRTPDVGGGIFGRRKGKVRRRSRRRGRAGLALGIGAGALGVGLATNALASGNPQIKAEKSNTTIPEGFIDRFQSIVEKFNNIIDGMLNKKPKPAPGGGSSGGGASTDPGSTDNNGGGGNMSLGGGAETDEEKAWLKTIRAAEGTAGEDGYGKVFGGEVVPELAEGKMTVNEVIQLQRTGKMPDRLGGREVNYGTYDGKVSGASGAYQFMPDTLESLLRNTDTSGDTLLTPKLQDQFGLQLLKGRGIDPTKKATIEGMNKASVEWAGLGTHHGQTSRTSAESLKMYNTFLNNSGAKVSPTPPSVTPGKEQSSSKEMQSKSIARTATSQKTSASTIVPISMGSQQNAPARPGPASSQPVDNKPAQKTNPVPTLTSVDDDNFFAMTSKLAYGIVD